MIKTMPDEKAIELLRGGLPAPSDEGSASDLWPLVQRRIADGNRQAMTADWILAIALVLLCLIHPSLAAILLLHL